MERILNFRKLGDGFTNIEGKKIKNIYRSADVSMASENDIDALLQNEIRNVIDLRSDFEIIAHPTLADERIQRVHVNIMDEAKQNDMSQFKIEQMEKFMCDLYGQGFIASEGFKNELKYILSLEGKPFLFHCTAGKDRTGVTGAILMFILGFSKEQIIEEYLRIDEKLVNALKSRVVQSMKDFGINLESQDSEQIGLLATVKPEFIEAYINGILNTYGTVEKYISENLQLTDNDLVKLKEYYLG